VTKIKTVTFENLVTPKLELGTSFSQQTSLCLFPGIVSGEQEKKFDLLPDDVIIGRRRHNFDEFTTSFASWEKRDTKF
jgi:hypothetical protein